MIDDIIVTWLTHDYNARPIKEISVYCITYNLPYIYISYYFSQYLLSELMKVLAEVNGKLNIKKKRKKKSMYCIMWAKKISH